jgi:hypothetical protein
MKKILIAFMVTILSVTGFSMEIGGVNMPDSLKVGDANLILNGAGLRKKLWIKVYAGGLYLKAKEKDQTKIINADEPMAIRMEFIYNGVSAEKLIGAWNEGFENATKGNTAQIKKEIDTFNGYFKEEAKKGDVYEIIYVPQKGTTLIINGKESGTIKGLAFKKALFGIWLCDKPADEDLKEGMLGD